jgi:flap endonuclease-1
MYEINLRSVLKGLDVNMDQFIDICILCGCDYSSKIDGIGPIKAHKMIRQHGNIEGVVKALKGNEKYNFCDKFEYIKARELFKDPLRSDGIKLKWGKLDYDKLYDFFCKEKGFNPKRLDNAKNRISNI